MIGGLTIFELYIYDKTLIGNTNVYTSGFIVDKQKISLCTILKSQNKIYDLYWYLNTRGNCTKYFVMYKNKIIHHSYATNRIFKFPFMMKNDLQIGNCYTDINYRGKGIYQFVIKNIVNEYFTSNPNGDVFMLVKNNNTASISGVLKAGFKKISKIETIKLFGLIKIYRKI